MPPNCSFIGFVTAAVDLAWLRSLEGGRQIPTQTNGWLEWGTHRLSPEMLLLMALLICDGYGAPGLIGQPIGVPKADPVMMNCEAESGVRPFGEE